MLSVNDFCNSISSISLSNAKSEEILSFELNLLSHHLEMYDELYRQMLK
jgi:hypothetical protein